MSTLVLKSRIDVTWNRLRGQQLETKITSYPQTYHQNYIGQSNISF